MYIGWNFEMKMWHCGGDTKSWQCSLNDNNNNIIIIVIIIDLAVPFLSVAQVDGMSLC